MADQQLIEIAKSLSVEARVLILDEPTASLSAHEVERLFTIVRRLRDRGVVDPVRQPPARRGLRAVRPGDGLPRRPARHHDADERAHDRRPRPAHGRPGRVAVPEGRDADRRRPPRGRGPDPGRRLPRRRRSRSGPARSSGFAGLVGAGRTEVARVLFGIDQRDAGEIRLGGDAGRLRQPVGRDARRDRLPARGPPPGGPRPRLLDRPERHAADPAPPLPAAARPRRRPSARSPTSTPSSSTSG